MAGDKINVPAIKNKKISNKDLQKQPPEVFFVKKCS